MKFVLSIIVLIATHVLLSGQEYMFIHHDDGTVTKIPINEIDSIVFYEGDIPEGAFVSDIDGNVYKTIELGTQVWMAENLKTTKFNDGIPIPHETDDETWANLLTPAYCWFDNNESSYKDWYGGYYNWHAVSIGKLCPSGWHVPSRDEWTTLIEYLISNGYNYDGTTSGDKVAKALASTSGWNSSTNTGAPGNDDFPDKRNATGFSAEAGGRREGFTFNGHFSAWSLYAVFWTSTEKDEFAYYRKLERGYTGVYEIASSKKFGHNVRCIKD